MIVTVTMAVIELASVITKIKMDLLFKLEIVKNQVILPPPRPTAESGS